MAQAGPRCPQLPAAPEPPSGEPGTPGKGPPGPFPRSFLARGGILAHLSTPLNMPDSYRPPPEGYRRDAGPHGGDMGTDVTPRSQRGPTGDHRRCLVSAGEPFGSLGLIGHGPPWGAPVTFSKGVQP